MNRGHDFRPAYRQLDSIRNKVRGVPIVAVTATATESVRNDIIRVLKLRNPLISCSGFDRPNLEFRVHLKGDMGPWADLRPQIRGNTTGSIIIYCLTRKQTEDLAQMCQSNGIVCEAYHAGLSVKQRRTVHEKFVRDQVQVICATIAFGMGIDKPDVRLVIHYGASKDIESYYQEVGRAGRDGQPAKCVMFYNRGDFLVHTNLREVGQGTAELKKHLEKLSEKMWDYLNTRECRRLFILQYFEGAETKCQKRKNCCDNCERNMQSTKDCDKYEGLDQEGRYDFTEDAKKLIGTIQLYKGLKGVNASVLTLRGSKAKSVPDFAQRHPLFSSGKDKPEEWWKSLAILLERESLLKKETIKNGYGSQPKFKIAMQRIFATHKGVNWLQSPTPLKLTPAAEMFPILQRKKAPSTSDPSTSTSGTFNSSQGDKLKQELVQVLLQKRAEIATSLDIMPYMVASNSSLYQIACARPLNLDEFRAAKPDGFNEAKIAKFGPKFLQAIHAKLKYVPSKSGETKTMRELLRYNPVGNTKLTTTIIEVHQKFQEGMSPGEIAKQRNVQLSTVNGYLATAILCGLPMTKIDLVRLGIDQNIFENIRLHLPKSFEDGISLKSIKADCLPHITWDAVRLVGNYFYVRWHLNQLKQPYIDPDRDISPIRPTNTKKASEELKSPEQQLLDDDNDDLLLAAEAQISNQIKVPPVLETKKTIDCFEDDDDVIMDADFVTNLDQIERDAGIEYLPVSQDNAGKRLSTQEHLSQYEAKKPKIQGGLDIAYGGESSDEDTKKIQTVSSGGAWMNKDTQQSTSKNTKGSFVKKVRSKLF